MRDAARLGMSLWNASDEELARTHAVLVAGLATGTLRPLIGQELPLKEAPRTHEAVMQSGTDGARSSSSPDATNTPMSPLTVPRGGSDWWRSQSPG